MEAALKVEPARRAALIRDAAQGDESLMLAVFSMLEQSKTAVDESESSDPSNVSSHLQVSTEPARPSDRPDAEAFAGTARFEVRRRLGSGAFGTVYESFDRDQRRLVALKVLRRTDPELLYRFKREFRALVDIRHRNLVELYELFSEEPFWFFSMERVYGVHFLRYVEHRERPALAPGPVACHLERLQEASLQLAQGIEALHNAGIVHRDIKPGNVLVSDDGRVRLLDFGVVKESRIEGRRTIIAGTPAFMSPEQMLGLSITEASDWYSFGVLLFQALTGCPSDQLVLAGTSDLPIWPATFSADVPEVLNRLCYELLSHNPRGRPTGREVIELLGGLALDTTRTTQVLPAAEEEPVGRESQLITLAQALHATKQSGATVVNLYGRSGIGKSTILRTFCRRLARDEPDVVVLSGRCHESETVPFKALDDLVDGLSRYLTSLAPLEAEALAPRDAQYLVRAFPVLAKVEAITRPGRRLSNISDSQESRARAFASLQELLSRLADRTAVVLAIDDLQWGDLDSAAFMVMLLTGPAPPSLLLIASYRSEDGDTSPFLQSWCSRLAGIHSLIVHDVEVGELSASESRILADRLLSSNVRTNPQQAALIAQESGGSPFLIEELAQDTVRGTNAPEAAIGLRQVIERRLGSLPEDARALVETIAVAGRPIFRSVAIAAAGLAPDSYATVSMLVSDRLVRLRNIKGHKEVEVYHDRLRETIVQAIPASRRRERHLALARALEANGGIDPAVLAMHFKDGGEPVAATEHAFAAAEHAAEALAFDRAAHFYQLTLEQGRWPRETSISVRRKLGTALVNAGRGVDAARVYLEASREAESSIGAELQHLAAEQLLRSGHTEEGLALLRGIARESGIWLANKPWQATASIVWHVFRIACHGLSFRQRASTEVHKRDLMLLDVYWSLGIGLWLVDVIRGSDFLIRHLLLALKVGDPQRAAMSMAVSATGIPAARGHESQISRKLLKKAQELTEYTSHSQTLGLIATMEAFCAILTGDWNRGAQLSARADSILRDKCAGVAWERGTNTSLGITAAIHLGQWGKLVDYAKRLPGLVEEARVRGDIYTIAYLLPGAFFGDLVSDRPQRSDELWREVFSYFPQQGFFVPHLNWMLEQIETALYEGNADLAWTVANSGWPALSKSFLFRVNYLVILATVSKARAALAVAAVSPDDTAKYLRHAMACARQIERKRTSWGCALALLIRACVANAEGNRSTTLDLLAKAETQLDAAQMTHWVAVCRYRRGTLLGGLEGLRLMSMAEAWVRSEQVVSPRRIFDMLAPGRWEA